MTLVNGLYYASFDITTASAGFVSSMVFKTNSVATSIAMVSPSTVTRSSGQFVNIPVDGYHTAAVAPDECAKATLKFLAKHKVR
jgi:hypothetical protein